jgi:hypothetical protein
MQNSDDFHSLPVNPIRNDVVRCRDNEFTCAWYATRSSDIRSIGQQSSRLSNPPYGPYRGVRIILRNPTGNCAKIVA